MGIQLSKLFSSRNYKVIFLTRNAKNLETIYTNRYGNSESAEKNYNFSTNIKYSESFIDLKECSIIFECLVEDIDIKKEYIDQILKNTNGLIASCTSTFTLQEISDGFLGKERINIIHFSNPVSAMKIVEVVYPTNISQNNKHYIKELLASIEYKIIEVPDIKGFVINSILFPLLYSAIRINFDYGVSKKSINDLMKIGCGFPMGPFEIIELVGLDTVLRVLKNLDFYVDEDFIKKFELKD
jgi:3-hydroxybutyryl-CoA dehydrogenase